MVHLDPFYHILISHPNLYQHMGCPATVAALLAAFGAAVALSLEPNTTDAV